MAAYLTGTQLAVLMDTDRWAQYLTTPLNGPVTPAEVPTNPTVLQYLQIGAGIIDAACLEASRYQPADLVNLATVTPLTNSGMLLLHLNDALAFGSFMVYKGFSQDEQKNAAPDYFWALDYIDKLNLGVRIFDIPGNVQAGLMTSAVMGAVLDANPLRSIKNQQFWGFPVCGRYGYGGYGGNW